MSDLTDGAQRLLSRMRAEGCARPGERIHSQRYVPDYTSVFEALASADELERAGYGRVTPARGFALNEKGAALLAL